MAENSSGGGCLNLVWFLLLTLGGAAGWLGIASTVAPPPTSPVLELVLAPTEAGATAEALDSAAAVLEQRLLRLVSGGQIQPEYSVIVDAAALIRVQVTPGTLPAEALTAALIRPGYLEFVDFSSIAPEAVSSYEGTTIATTASAERVPPAPAAIIFPTVLTHADILDAVVVTAADGSMAVEIQLTPAAGERLGAFTEAHQLQPMAITLDNVVLLIPTIQARIETPILLSDSYSEAEAHILAAQISSQPLPLALTLVSIGAAP